MFKTITLKPGKETPLLRRHPWVFSGALQTTPKSLQDGDLVLVNSSQGQRLATGYYQNGSIAVRILDFTQKDWSSFEELLTSHIKNAKNFRLSQNLPSEATDAYRLIHGEGDNLPGLIIDIFGSVAVVQAHTSGVLGMLPSIVSSLISAFREDPLTAIVSRSNSTVQGGTAEILWGALPQELIIKENGAKFLVSVIDGQKTGFFLDQRDNRDFIRLSSKGKTVLNLFCYTGGFSVAALHGGARHVVSVDSSKPATVLCEANLNLNALNHPGSAGIDVECITECSDVFDYLKLNSDGAPQKQYDLVICDPPAFAKHSSALKAAIKGYWRLNKEVIKSVSRGGSLATFSCSQVVSTQAFESAVVSACVDIGRTARIVHRFFQSACHPVSVFHPEGVYLKGLFIQFD